MDGSQGTSVALAAGQIGAAGFLAMVQQHLRADAKLNNLTITIATVVVALGAYWLVTPGADFASKDFWVQALMFAGAAVGGGRLAADTGAAAKSDSRNAPPS